MLKRQEKADSEEKYLMWAFLLASIPTWKLYSISNSTRFIFELPAGFQARQVHFNDHSISPFPSSGLHIRCLPSSQRVLGNYLRSWGIFLYPRARLWQWRTLQTLCEDLRRPSCEANCRQRRHQDWRSRPRRYQQVNPDGGEGRRINFSTFNWLRDRGGWKHPKETYNYEK